MCKWVSLYVGHWGRFPCFVFLALDWSKTQFVCSFCGGCIDCFVGFQGWLFFTMLCALVRWTNSSYSGVPMLGRAQVTLGWTYVGVVGACFKNWPISISAITGWLGRRLQPHAPLSLAQRQRRRVVVSLCVWPVALWNDGTLSSSSWCLFSGRNRAFCFIWRAWGTWLYLGGSSLADVVVADSHTDGVLLMMFVATMSLIRSAVPIENVGDIPWARRSAIRHVITPQLCASFCCGVLFLLMACREHSSMFSVFHPLSLHFSCHILKVHQVPMIIVCIYRDQDVVIQVFFTHEFPAQASWCIWLFVQEKTVHADSGLAPSTSFCPFPQACPICS